MVQEISGLEGPLPGEGNSAIGCRSVPAMRGEEQPMVSGREGPETLKAIMAVKQAARSGDVVKP